METTKTETTPTEPAETIVDATQASPADVMEGEVVGASTTAIVEVPKTEETPTTAIVEAPKVEIVKSLIPVGTIRLRTNHPQVLKQVALAAGALIDEVNLEATKLSEMDESHICLMVMNHKQLWDAEYTWTPDAAKHLGINLEDFTKILNAAIRKETTFIEVAQDETNCERLVVKTNNARYRLRLVEIDEEKIPPTAELEVEFDVTGDIDPNKLRESLKGVELFQDTAVIVLDPQAKMAFISAEGEVGDVCIDVPLTHVETRLVGDMKPVRGVFSLNFLKNILKAKLSEMHLSLAEKTPLRVDATINLPSTRSYKVPNGKGGLKEVKDPFATRKVAVVYFLAPRVEEEESYESD